MITSKPHRLLELDALRGLAALFVVLFHFTRHEPIAKYGFCLGVSAVDMFFMISGFVIFLTLNKTRTWQEFMVSRFSRLYPAYWTAVTFTTVLLFCLQFHTSRFNFPLIKSYFANLTMFQLYFKQPNIDKSYWTLIVEMLFYLYMLSIFISRKLKYIELIGVITMLPVLVYSCFLKDNFTVLHSNLSVKLPVINHFPLFFAGILFIKLNSKKEFILHIY